MHPEAAWQRAILLFQQQRHDLAAQELRGLLAQVPDHAPAHALLAQALLRTDQADEALDSAKRAVGLDPELDFAYGALAVVHWHRNEHEAAAAAIARAIELDPDDVHHRSTLAQVRIAQRRWDDALAAADDGLALDPQDTDCLNLRTLALARLGRGAEAAHSADASLARDPDNPYSHHTRGVMLLHQGDAKGALHHFQETLRRDPNHDGARAGLVEALKARNPLYRLVLRWFLWLERFSGGRQVAIVVGLYLGSRIAGDSLESAGQPTAATVVRFSWLGFVLLTSCAVPIFNLMLLLHPIGRHALERRARNDAGWLGGCVVVLVAVGGMAWFGSVFGELVWAQVGWWFWLVFLLPVSGLGLFHPGPSRIALQTFCVAAVGVWTWWCVRFQSLFDAAIASAKTTGTAESAKELLRTAMAPVLEHRGHFTTLLLVTALSTWFVMLAPKGVPQRRKGAAQ